MNSNGKTQRGLMSEPRIGAVITVYRQLHKIANAVLCVPSRVRVTGMDSNTLMCKKMYIQSMIFCRPPDDNFLRIVDLFIILHSPSQSTTNISYYAKIFSMLV